MRLLFSCPSFENTILNQVQCMTCLCGIWYKMFLCAEALRVSKREMSVATRGTQYSPQSESVCPWDDSQLSHVEDPKKFVTVGWTWFDFPCTCLFCTLALFLCCWMYGIIHFKIFQVHMRNNSSEWHWYSSRSLNYALELSWFCRDWTWDWIIAIRGTKKCPQNSFPTWKSSGLHWKSCKQIWTKFTLVHCHACSEKAV